MNRVVALTHEAGSLAGTVEDATLGGALADTDMRADIAARSLRGARCLLRMPMRYHSSSSSESQRETPRSDRHGAHVCR